MKAGSSAGMMRILKIVASGTEFFVATSSVRDNFRRLDGAGGNGERLSLPRWLT
jgi:hypothetical protein